MAPVVSDYDKPLYAAPPAQQLQQAVARAVERCAAICEDLADRACAAQEGPTDDTTNVMLRQVATLGARECAALIRAKGTQ